MRRSSFREPKKVLIFNVKRELIGIAKSLFTASAITEISPQTISLCCTGKRVVSHGLYFRHIHPNVEINVEDDLGRLDLIDYDKMCKEVRYYYPKNFDSTKWRSKRKLTAEQIREQNK